MLSVDLIISKNFAQKFVTFATFCFNPFSLCVCSTQWVLLDLREILEPRVQLDALAVMDNLVVQALREILVRMENEEYQ